ncbi:hypothetical protein M8J76_001541 [Diaphorina citri]|nr:hypothetical protein M8J76_001541 [Diaphorina citri]
MYVLIVFITLHDKVKPQNNSHPSSKHKFYSVTDPINTTTVQVSSTKTNYYSPYLNDNGQTAPNEESIDEDEEMTHHSEISISSPDRKFTNAEQDFRGYLDAGKANETFPMNGLNSSKTAISAPDDSRLSENATSEASPRTVFKEISNFPVNIMKVNVTSPLNPSSHSKKRRQIESKTSSVRVVVTRTTRNVSSATSETVDPNRKYVDISALRKAKISSKYRASELQNADTMVTEPNKLEYPLSSNNITVNQKTPTPEMNRETMSRDFHVVYPSISSDLANLISIHEPSGHYNMSLEYEIPTYENQTSLDMLSFEDKVKQIKEILAQLSPSDYSEDNGSDDYDYYDEELPEQLKYLTLFEEKYGKGRGNGGSISDPFYKGSKDIMGDSSTGTGIDVNSNTNGQFIGTNSGPAQEAVAVSDIEAIGAMIHGEEKWRNSENYIMNHIQVRNIPLDISVWMTNNATGNRLPPSPFSKSVDMVNDGINMGEMKKEKTDIHGNKEMDASRVGQNVQSMSLRNANEKLMRAAESLSYKDAQDHNQAKYETPNDTAFTNKNGDEYEVVSINANNTNLNQEHEVVTQMPETIETKDATIPIGQLPKMVNTFLYDYEENNSLAVENPLMDLESFPTFLDTGVSDGDKSAGGFQHFSTNDLDSDQFTSSFSNAQIRMYELYRDHHHLIGPALVQDSSNDTDFNSSAAAMPLVAYQFQESRCFTGSKEGLCFTSEICTKKGGQVGSNCNFQGLYCCTFTYSCGDVSKERVTYFKSPHHPARPSSGLTCDYDVAIRQDVIEFEKVNLARKVGGVCDIDQLFILNSIDGPTTGQCGPLSGYATTVAVKASQIKPLKIALLIQSASPFYWYIKVIQLPCSHVKNFKAPLRCGRTIPRTYDINAINSWQRKWYRIGRKGRQNSANKKVWWKYPEPILNTYYFSYTKKHLQQFHQGTTYRQPRRRIILGGEADIGEFPWQVAIALDGMFFCGGALLNEHFVLTAAHCIMTRDTPVSELVLHLGDHDLTQLNETSHVRRGVRRVLFHSHFHPFVLSNDIALLQLDRPVPLTGTIQPVCLPQKGESFIGKRGHVVGWGVTSFPMGEPSPTLQKLEVKVLSNARCSTGDSGGPLTFEQDGYHVLAGIVSYGVTGCAIMPSYPDLYTRVSEYIRWIHVNAIVTK